MPTPNENIATLIDYWRDSISGIMSNQVGRLASAIAAMKELIAQARGNPVVRTDFANHEIFERALLLERVGTTDHTLELVDNPIFGAVLSQADSDLRPPRQIMLDGIWEGATGGWFTASDASGTLSWLNSAQGSGNAMAETISSDQNPNVRIAALRLIRDLSIPVAWAKALQASNVFGLLAEQLPRSGWPQTTRVVLQALSELAEARISADLAKTATGTFTMPDGTVEMVAEGKKTGAKSWGAIVVAATLSLVGGAWLHTKNH